MSNTRGDVKFHLSALGLVLLACAGSMSCTKGEVAANSPVASKPDAATSESTSRNDGGFTFVTSDVPHTSEAGPCVPLECTTSSGHYCGFIGDGCNHTLDCGGCPADQVCGGGGPNICGGGANCVPTFTCEFVFTAVSCSTALL